MNDYSLEALTAFLEYAGSKGLLNKATASAKRIAVDRVFRAADSAERADVRSIDIPHMMSRFINLSGSSFRPESLASYQSRVKSAIDEFVSWKSDPIGFRPNHKRVSGKKNRPSQQPIQSKPQLLSAVRHVDAVMGATVALPIPIRSDLTVQINGIPFDLTKAEASKIANVVLAMATET